LPHPGQPAGKTGAACAERHKWRTGEELLSQAEQVNNGQAGGIATPRGISGPVRTSILYYRFEGFRYDERK